MNCGVVQQRIIDDPANRHEGEIKAHLQNCTECQQLCDDLMALEEMAQSLGDQYKVPEDFGHKVLSQVPQGGLRWLVGLRPVFLTLAIFMLSFGFFWLDGDVSHSDASVVIEEAPMVQMDDWEDVDSSFIEVVIEDPDEGQMMLHLPSVIEIHRTELHEDFNYQNTGY